MPRTKSSSKLAISKPALKSKISKRPAKARLPRHGPTKEMNNICFLLEITTTKTAPQRGFLLNRFEEPDSLIKQISHSEITRYDEEIENHIPLTKEELNAVGFVGKEFTLHNTWLNNKKKLVGETKITFTNDKDYFTIQEIVRRIIQFEKLDRPKTSWFGGVDCHHIYFEGIHLNRDKAGYGISWGS